MTETVLDYLNKQKESINVPEVAEDFQSLEQDYSKKLWNQLGSHTEKVVYSQKFVDAVDLNEFYHNFIHDFEHRINSLQLVYIIWPVAKHIYKKNPEQAYEFLERFNKSVAKNPPALVRLETAKIEIRLLSHTTSGVKPVEWAVIQKMIEGTQKLVDQLSSITAVHAVFYRVSAMYLKEIGDHAAYYREALRYLGCEDPKKLTQQDKRMYATTLGFAALLGKDIYNFGELLTHPIVKSLEGSPEEWLVGVLKAFNHGDINSFMQYEKVWSQWPELNNNRSLLLNKLRLLCLMEIGNNHIDTDRFIPFSKIADEAQVPLNEVEFLVMKALSHGLIYGVIDHVNQTVNITWIQPRVLTPDQSRRIMENGIKDLFPILYTTTPPNSKEPKRCVVVMDRLRAVSFRHGGHRKFQPGQKLILYPIDRSVRQMEVIVFKINDDFDFIIFRTINDIGFKVYPDCVFETELGQEYKLLGIDLRGRPVIKSGIVSKISAGFVIGDSHAELGDSGAAIIYGDRWFIGIAVGRRKFELSDGAAKDIVISIVDVASHFSYTQIVPAQSILTHLPAAENQLLESEPARQRTKKDEFRDSDAEAIVKRLEQRYGTGTVGAKSSKKRKAVHFEADDVMDKGMGYDLTDNFIDDSEAYDEWVPSSMDTIKRGHYVNKGQLEFRQVDSEEDSSDEDSHDDDDDSDEEEEDDENATDDDADMEEEMVAKASSSSVTVVAPPPPVQSTPAIRTSSSTLQPQLATPTTEIVLTDDNGDSPEMGIGAARVRLSQAGVPPTLRLPNVKRFNNGADKT